MLDFLSRNKIFVGTIVGTLVLLVGGVFFLTKDNGTPPASVKVSDEILAPSDSQRTSGIVGGTYLAATSSATISLVEFGDYQCPACADFNPLLKQLLTELAGQVNFVFRDFPLSQHKNANISAYAAQAAALQGKFWEMHDKLYESQNEWAAVANPTSIFVKYAESMGLDTAKFEKDMNSVEVKKIVEKGTNDGNLAGLNATPTFYLNGVKMNLPGSYEEFKGMVILGAQPK